MKTRVSNVRRNVLRRNASRCTRFKLTQVPVRQRVVVVILVLVDVLPFLALPAFMLQSDGAGLVEARLDVLLAVWNGLVLLDVTLRAHREVVESKAEKAEPSIHPSTSGITATFGLNAKQHFILAGASAERQERFCCASVLPQKAKQAVYKDIKNSSL